MPMPMVQAMQPAIRESGEDRKESGPGMRRALPSSHANTNTHLNAARVSCCVRMRRPAVRWRRGARMVHSAAAMGPRSTRPAHFTHCS